MRFTARLLRSRASTRASAALAASGHCLDTNRLMLMSDRGPTRTNQRSWRAGQTVGSSS